jgi:hypothetical protein
MFKIDIDMGRPNLLYAVGVGILTLISLVLSNVPESNLSTYWEVPYKREVSVALFLLGTTFGLLAMMRHIQRTKTPWKVPQSQVFIYFSIFFSLTLTALILAK